MWIIYALCSALFAGITSILAKCGLSGSDSTLVTAIRTIAVSIFSWIMVFIVGSFQEIFCLSGKTWIFLILSGIATGASWLCYFKALQQGDINKVVPIDKSSTVLTIVLAFLFLHENMTIINLFAVVSIAFGTFLMIELKENKNMQKKKTWILYAMGSAIFASLTSILGKIGISQIESNLGTAIRTLVVLVMSWLMVFITHKQNQIYSITKKEYFYIILSGIATGCSWLCYWRALQDGLVSVVVPIDKLSLLVTVAFSYLVFGEKLSKKSLIGLILITAGTLSMLIK